MWEPKGRSLCKKHQQRWDCETSSASGLLPERGNWEVSVWASTWADWMVAALSSSSPGSGAGMGLTPVHFLLEIQNTGRGSGWGDAVVPTWPLGLQSVGPKLCRNQSMEQIPDCGKIRVGASVSHMRLKLVLGLGRGREQGKEECSWLWVYQLTS